MTAKPNKFSYRWAHYYQEDLVYQEDAVYQEDTVVSPDAPHWSHAGLTLTAEGLLAFPAADGSTLVLLDPETGVRRTARTGLTEMHGLAVGDADDLWIVDPGEKSQPSRAYEPVSLPGRVVRIDHRGNVLQELSQPEHPAYIDRCWRPTSIALGPESIWVADGYGAGLVHRFGRDGEHQLTIDGAQTGTPFDCPHGLIIDKRSSSPTSGQLLIADRGNRRIVSMTPDGAVSGVITDRRMTSPSSFAQHGNLLVVTELFGGLLALGEANEVISMGMDAPDTVPLGGWPEDPWPNSRRLGSFERPVLSDNELHSPHGIAIGHDGSIYLTEWVIGGRYLRLKPS